MFRVVVCAFSASLLCGCASVGAWHREVVQVDYGAPAVVVDYGGLPSVGSKKSIEPKPSLENFANVTDSSPQSIQPLTAPDAANASLVPLRTAVVGSCDCPYDVKSNGALCGASSAWSRPGGKAPACYAGEGIPLSPQLYKPACAESGSCYGDISVATGRPKTVYVGGYYRKDGTYVRGYYRSK